MSELQPHRVLKGPVAVGHYTAAQTATALNSKGAILAALYAGWASIAGPSLAAYTFPSKLSRGSNGASYLVLNADAGRALDVQYMLPQILERINLTLGFPAVTAIRIVQGPRRAAPSPKSAFARKTPSTDAAPVSPLDAAFLRMRAGLAGKRDP